MREAAIEALREAQNQPEAVEEKSTRPRVLDLQVSMRHFDRAFSKVQPSVSEKEEREYERAASHLGAHRSGKMGFSK